MKHAFQFLTAIAAGMIALILLAWHNSEADSSTVRWSCDQAYACACDCYDGCGPGGDVCSPDLEAYLVECLLLCQQLYSC